MKLSMKCSQWSGEMSWFFFERERAELFTRKMLTLFSFEKLTKESRRNFSAHSFLLFCLLAFNILCTAIQQYVNTIGGLEASYVIMKFLDAARIHNLTAFLQVKQTNKYKNKQNKKQAKNKLTKFEKQNRQDNTMQMHQHHQTAKKNNRTNTQFNANNESFLSSAFFLLFSSLPSGIAREQSGESGSHDVAALLLHQTEGRQPNRSLH